MQWINVRIQRIQALMDGGSAQSLTYAALEARLAIEQLCYERLQVAHDYISHADLKKWQPSRIVSQLIQEVEPLIASTAILSIGKEPVQPDARDMTQQDYEKLEYVEVGRQIGFDNAKIGKLWHALGSFLHVQLPKNKDDIVHEYGDELGLRNKISDVIVELKKIKNQTLVFSGVGELVTFKCECGSMNKRRKEFLHSGQVVSCVNPDCIEKWEIRIDGDDVFFKQQSVPIKCGSCQQVHEFPLAALPDPKPYNAVTFDCRVCGAKNRLRWKLMHELQANPSR